MAVPGLPPCAVPKPWGLVWGAMKRAIEQETLQALVATGAAREFRVLREGEAWRLELRLGVKWLPVRSRREPVRLWRSLTAVGRFCEGVGIKVLTVEL